MRTSFSFKLLRKQALTCFRTVPHIEYLRIRSSARCVEQQSSRYRYGRNPYTGYDDISSTPLFRGKTSGRLRLMEKVIAVEIDGKFKAYPYSITRGRHVVYDRVSGQELVIFHTSGASSALDAADISDSRDFGATGVFDPNIDGRRLQFRYEKGGFIDAETGSRWNILGQAVSGELRGKQLRSIAHGDYFAFAWFAFRPETEIFHG